jgi:hypothetical protein
MSPPTAGLSGKPVSRGQPVLWHITLNWQRYPHFILNFHVDMSAFSIFGGSIGEDRTLFGSRFLV